MTKKDMAKKIADELGLTASVVQTVIQMLLDSITETLVRVHSKKALKQLWRKSAELLALAA